MATVPFQPLVIFLNQMSGLNGKRFKQYHMVSGLWGNSDEWQASTFFYCLRVDVEHVLTNQISDDNRRSRIKF